jgi:SAM-dependent methyltransferase
VLNDRPPVCDYEGSDYQASFWDRGERGYEDAVEEIALRRLLPESGTQLLELGAGAGRNTPRYTGFERVVLLDYSLSQLQQAQERLGLSDRYIYVAGDVYRLPFVSGLFDAATMIRTLHHLSDPPLALRQVRRTLQPGAAFILEYANKRNLKAILRYAARRQTWNPFSLKPVEFAKLNFDFHPAAVRLWLQSSGFTLQRQLTVSHFRMGWLKRLVPLKLLVQMDALAQWSGSLWQFTPSVFVRARAEGSPASTSPQDFFQCPECGHAELENQQESLLCPGCGRRWRIQGGIYDFRQPLG